MIACSYLSEAMDYVLVSESEVTAGVRALSCIFELILVCRVDANECCRKDVA